MWLKWKNHCPAGQVCIPCRTCGLQNATVLQKHSSKSEGGNKIHTRELMWQASCYQTFPPLAIQVKKYSVDSVVQSHGILVSKIAQKWMQYKRWHQLLPRSTRPQTSNKFHLSWKKSWLFTISVIIICIFAKQCKTSGT